MIFFRKSYVVLKGYDVFVYEVFVIFLIFYFVFILYFSLEYGKIYIFYIFVVDNDGDKIKC